MKKLKSTRRQRALGASLDVVLSQFPSEEHVRCPHERMLLASLRVRLRASVLSLLDEPGSRILLCNPFCFGWNFDARSASDRMAHSRWNQGADFVLRRGRPRQRKIQSACPLSLLYKQKLQRELLKAKPRSRSSRSRHESLLAAHSVPLQEIFRRKRALLLSTICFRPLLLLPPAAPLLVSPPPLLSKHCVHTPPLRLLFARSVRDTFAPGPLALGDKTWCYTASVLQREIVVCRRETRLFLKGLGSEKGTSFR